MLCEYCTHVSSYYLNQSTVDALFSLFTFMKSCEKGIILKEHIVLHMHLNFPFKQALHFSTLVIKLFNSCTKLLFNL